MKILGKILSNRGHKEIDYLVRLSPHEFKLFKDMVSNTKGLGGLKRALQSTKL